jgi:hypothetical protein
MQVTSLCEVIIPGKNLSSMIIAGSDGIIRIIANDNLKLAGRPKYFYVDKFERSDYFSLIGKRQPKFGPLFNLRQISSCIDYLSTPEGILYVVAMTSKSN